MVVPTHYRGYNLQNIYEVLSYLCRAPLRKRFVTILLQFLFFLILIKKIKELCE